MKRIGWKRYCALFLVLCGTVGILWLLGGDSKSGEIPRAAENDTSSAAASPVPTATPSASPTATPVPAEDTLLLPQAEPEAGAGLLTGVWVPYMSLSTEEHTQAAFEDNFKNIADSAREKGIRALFVHVRPFCDALYPSKLYPWSHILTGVQGQDPGFDPLQFMVEYAHENGMEFHAWINPLRVKTTENPGELAAENPYAVLGEESPYYFMETETVVCLDPAYPYVRSLVADGAAEIAKNYDVDGIHFDDYFYPSEDESLDREAYALYTQGVDDPLPLPEWRKANISAMVQEVYEKVKQANPKAVFGISPQGNIENDENMGADVRSWCAVPGYLDYICPQLYYSFENPALGYGEALEQWLSLPKHEDLQLYAGLALYKAGTDADSGTWLLSDDIIRRQIEAAQAAECAGVLLYSSAYLDTEQTAAEMEHALEVLAPVQEESENAG